MTLLRSASTPPLFAAQLHPASVADGALSATWSGRGEGLKADFDLTLQAPAAAPRNVLPVSGAARGTLEDGRGLTLHLADSEFRTPHSTITARGTLSTEDCVSRRGRTARAHRHHRRLRRMAAFLPGADCRPLRHPFGAEVACGVFRATQRQLRGTLPARACEHGPVPVSRLDLGPANGSRRTQSRFRPDLERAR